MLPLTQQQYIEVVEVLDHPASDKAPFGQAVRARSEAGGGWLGWVVAVDDISPVEKRLEREAVPGNRHRPDGVELRWKQVGVKGLQSDPQLPFFVQWESPTDAAPVDGSVRQRPAARIEIAGDPYRVSAWLGHAVRAPHRDVRRRVGGAQRHPGHRRRDVRHPRRLVRI